MLKRLLFVLLIIPMGLMGIIEAVLVIIAECIGWVFKGNFNSELHEQFNLLNFMGDYFSDVIP